MSGSGRLFVLGLVWLLSVCRLVRSIGRLLLALGLLVRVVRGLIGGISCDGLGLGRVLCRMETDLIGGRVIVFTLGVVAGLVSSTLLTRFPVMLLISVLGGVFGRPAVSVVVLRTGMGMGFPSIQVCIPGSSRWCGRSCHERNLSEPSRGDREGHRCLGISRPGTSTRPGALERERRSGPGDRGRLGACGTLDGACSGSDGLIGVGGVGKVGGWCESWNFWRMFSIPSLKLVRSFWSISSVWTGGGVVVFTSG
jgi:hypothetical protein